MAVDPRHLEPALTEKETLLRDAFVAEYLKDFDPFKACLRLGFQATYATQWSQTLIQDGYVQRKLSYMMAKPAATPEQEELDRAMVENTLRLVMQRGSDSARVAAVREFRAMRGWGEGDGLGAEDLVEAFKRVAEQLPS
jgi:hypothetical protein